MIRLDRYLSKRVGIKRKDVRLLLAQGRVEVDGKRATDIGRLVSVFDRISVDGKVTQHRVRRYLMLNKPTGVVSATVDQQHTTVVDLLAQDCGIGLHIVGRLDFNATGLLLLTNDGRWSQGISQPDNKLLKRYRVSVDKPLTAEYIRTFERGMHFAYEDIITRPAQLTILGDYVAEVGLVEGRYHQLKRMFGHFDNKVLSIHRIAVGALQLDDQLLAGQSRDLTAAEVTLIASKEGTQSADRTAA
ncbi:MAG: pseudouridine synthase [Halioglobus sp.]|nr:pseudouridine synthase [Halioglobus sp.]